MQKPTPFPMGPNQAVRTIQLASVGHQYRRPESAVVALLAIVRTPPMSSDTPDSPDRDITTDAEFELALQTLLLSALENGLDLRGAWVYRNGEAYPDLEVLVTELAK